MDANTQAAESSGNRQLLALINIFIVVYGLGTFVMCSPPSIFRDAAVQAIKPIFNYLGLYQYFYMYAPTPPSVYTIHVCADITYADGTEKIWEFPRLESYKGDFYKHQSKHRYYQWKYYLFMPQENAQILPDAARWAARMNWNKTNPPVKVVLFNKPEFTQLPIVDTGHPTWIPGNESEYFTYDVKQEDL